MEWRGGGTRGVECVKWFSAGNGCLDRVGRGSGSRKWDASGIVPEGCQKLGLSLVRRGFSKYNEVACEGFTGLE